MKRAQINKSTDGDDVRSFSLVKYQVSFSPYSLFLPHPSSSPFLTIPCRSLVAYPKGYLHSYPPSKEIVHGSSLTSRVSRSQ